MWRSFAPVFFLVCASAWAQNVAVTGSVEIRRLRPSHRKPNSGDVVVWLTPLSEASSGSLGPARRRGLLVQKNKIFSPHIQVVPVGSEVDFPNRDPFFHNVFSLFEGKRFDLGLYEAGTTRSVLFDRPGVSYLFCNIHSEMSAVIIALDTPYYAMSDQSGQIRIAAVPPGRYTLHAWREGSSTEVLKAVMKSIVVSESESSFGKLVFPDNVALPLAHKNKYDQDYPSPTPPGQIYDRQ